MLIRASADDERNAKYSVTRNGCTHAHVAESKPVSVRRTETVTVHLRLNRPANRRQ